MACPTDARVLGRQIVREIIYACCAASTVARTAATAVGDESVSQFGGENKRRFGESLMHDVARLRG